ncbi:MAG: TolC family protein [Phycisphaerales bacterium]|nr:TolC family protein [Phycisphaerales bacterium]
MSDLHRRVLRITLRPLLGVAATLAVSGCQNELFAPEESVAQLEPGRIDRIEPVDAGSLAPGARVTPDAALERAIESGWHPPVYPQKAEVSIESVRVSTLQNNLDLKVQRYNPTLGVTRLDAELAKFEAVLNASATRNSNGVLTDLEEGSPTTTNSGSLSVDVPLATGGTLSAGTLFSETDSNLSNLLGEEPFEAGMEFSISQPLLRGAGIRTNTASIRIAKIDSQIVDSRTKLETIRILANADKSYWGLYRAWRQLGVRVQQHELAVEQLARAKRRVAAGDAAEIEVVRAESGLGSTIEQVIVADNSLRLRQRELKRIMNDPVVTVQSDTALRPMSDPNPLGLNLDAARLTELALVNRMEMLELELQLAIDAEQIDLRRNAALPLFTLDFSYNYSGDDTSLGSAYAAMGNSDGYAITANAQVPLGNEAARARISGAIATRLQRLATRDARRLAIIQETYNAVDAVQNAWQRILAARLESTLAARTLAAEQRQFEQGIRTSTDVLDASARLADAQSREVDALTGYEIALIDLSFATGTLLGGAHIDIAGERVPDPD